MIKIVLRINCFISICAIFFCLNHTVQAQIGMAVAKSDIDPYGSLAYRVEWGYNSSGDATDQAIKYLENKGYKKVWHRVINFPGKTLPDQGFFVVIKSEYLTGDKKSKVSYGIGVSPDSYDEAEMLAIENLEVHGDWNWNRVMGYTIDQKGYYDHSPQYQLIYGLKKTNTACGEHYELNTRVIAPVKNSTYQNMANAFKKRNDELGEKLFFMGHIITSSGYIGVLKCNTRCEDGSVISKYKFIEASTAEEINALAPHMKEIAGDPGEELWFVFELINMSQTGENASFIQESKDILNKFLKSPEDQETLKRWVGIGRRG